MIWLKSTDTCGLFFAQFMFKEEVSMSEKITKQVTSLKMSFVNARTIITAELSFDIKTLNLNLTMLTF